MRVNLLGPFAITVGDKSVGAWPRPVARRLCQLVLVSPGRRVSREVASDKLFPALAPRAAAHAVSKALSMARIVLADLGGPATEMLVGDRTHTYISPNCPVDIDLERHQDALRFALRLQPGSDRDAALAEALSDEGVLLEDEAYSDWALRPRDSLELARHEARLALARDRARGTGRSSPEAVGQAWEACLGNDPTCEEAACALMRLYSDQGRRYAAEAAYHRCHAALEELGLPGSPALEAAHALALPRASAGPVLVPVGAERVQEELRLVSVLFAELSVPSGSLVGPEELQEIRSGALAGLISHVEAFGGTLTSVSGAGMEAVFGAPVSHEDDPERAVRAAYRVQSDPRTANGRTSVRIGVESGPAVVGLTPVGYAAVGEAVGTAAFLASVAKDASVLAGHPSRYRGCLRVGTGRRTAAPRFKAHHGELPGAPQGQANGHHGPAPVGVGGCFGGPGARAGGAGGGPEGGHLGPRRRRVGGRRARAGQDPPRF